MLNLRNTGTNSAMKYRIKSGHTETGLELALEEIGKTANVRDGDVSYTGFSYAYHESLILGSVEILGLADPRTKASIVKQSLHDCARSNTWNVPNFRGFLSKNLNAHLRRKIVKYEFLTTISLPKFEKIARKIGDTRISTGKSARAIWTKLSPRIEEEARQLRIPLPTNYLPLKITVNERSLSEALHQAEEHLTLLRGIWNLSINQSTSLRMSSGILKPPNQIRPGPFIVMDTGKELSIWHIPSTRAYIDKSERAFSHKKKWDSALKYEANFRTKLKKCKYRGSIERAVIQYCDALDSSDFDASFLRLWSVLESLVIPGRIKNYDLLANRTAFLFKDFEFVRALMEVFRHLRNSYVHENRDFEDSEKCLYQLKNIVERMIEFHVGNSFGFNTLKEACRFFDSPRDLRNINQRIAELTEQVETLRCAKTFFKMS